MLEVIDLTGIYFRPRIGPRTIKSGTINSFSSKDDAMKVIYNTMQRPLRGDPRIPRFLLLEKCFEDIFAEVKAEIELLNIAVRLHSDASEVEACVTIDPSLSLTSPLRATPPSEYRIHS